MKWFKSTDIVNFGTFELNFNVSWTYRQSHLAVFWLQGYTYIELGRPDILLRSLTQGRIIKLLEKMFVWSRLQMYTQQKIWCFLVQLKRIHIVHTVRTHIIQTNFDGLCLLFFWDIATKPGMVLHVRLIYLPKQTVWKSVNN